MPSLPEPSRKPKKLCPDDFSDDEQFYKARTVTLKYNTWRYSLMCATNIVYMPPDEITDSPTKQSP